MFVVVEMVDPIRDVVRALRMESTVENAKLTRLLSRLWCCARYVYIYIIYIYISLIKALCGLTQLSNKRTLKVLPINW